MWPPRHFLGHYRHYIYIIRTLVRPPLSNQDLSIRTCSAPYNLGHVTTALVVMLFRMNTWRYHLQDQVLPSHICLGIEIAPNPGQSNINTTFNMASHTLLLRCLRLHYTQLTFINSCYTQQGCKYGEARCYSHYCYCFFRCLVCK